MTRSDVQIVPVDPFDIKLGGLLFPFVLQRIIEFSKTHYTGFDPMRQARELAARACAGDPSLLLLAFVAPDGRLIGHAVSTISESYGTRWLFVIQSKVDEPAGDVISRATSLGKSWGKARGAELIVFETRRSDSAWAKAYGFKTMRHLMYMPINGEPAGVEQGSVSAE